VRLCRDSRDRSFFRVAIQEEWGRPTGLLQSRVGGFLPEGGKNGFFHGKKNGPVKIVFAGKKIGFCQNIFFLYFYYNKILLYCRHYLN